MNKLRELADNLQSILKLLREEKEALIHNNGNVIAIIVEKKKEYIEKLSSFKGLPIVDDSKIMKLIQEIDELQETNSLLTMQALSFQNNLLESIAKSIKHSTDTYSPKGNYESSKTVNLIDQSI